MTYPIGAELLRRLYGPVVERAVHDEERGNHVIRLTTGSKEERWCSACETHRVEYVGDTCPVCLPEPQR
jgi:hypothetical protein